MLFFELLSTVIPLRKGIRSYLIRDGHRVIHSSSEGVRWYPTNQFLGTWHHVSAVICMAYTRLALFTTSDHITFTTSIADVVVIYFTFSCFKQSFKTY